jgi:hypothetical protein
VDRVRAGAISARRSRVKNRSNTGDPPKPPIPPPEASTRCKKITPHLPHCLTRYASPVPATRSDVIPGLVPGTHSSTCAERACLLPEELSEDERAEYTQLGACARAWQHLHTPPRELASLDPTITDADRGRAWELRLRPFILGCAAAHQEERRELAGLDARLGAERDAIEAVKRRAGGARPQRARDS